MVNSLYDLFDVPGAKPETEQLIVNGRYSLPPIDDPTGKRRSLQRVTNFVKQISDTEYLNKWKLRQVVLGLALREDLYDKACSLDPMQKGDTDQLVEQAIEAAKSHGSFVSGGNETGTALHNYTDNLGHTPARIRPKWAPKVENYHRALHEHGLRVVPGLSERLVISERYGTCGRLDDVYEDPWGNWFVADRKSQKDFYTWFEIGAQLALYQCSDAMWNEAECRFEDMPKLSPDYAFVAWMPLVHPGPDPEAVTLYDLPLEGPRKLLDEILLVRTLRTEARRWATPMESLSLIERIARDIRDAESFADLTRIARANPALNIEGDPLNRMAAKRWAELEQAEDGGAAQVALAPGVNVQHVSTYAPSLQQASILSIADRRPTDYGAALMAPVIVDDLAALFRAPAQDATFPVVEDERVPDDAGAAVPAPVLSEEDKRARLAMDPAYLKYAIVNLEVVTQARTPDEVPPPPPALRTTAEWCHEFGVVLLDTPSWRRDQKDPGTAISAAEFVRRAGDCPINVIDQERAVLLLRDIDKRRPHPVATAPHTNAFNHGATVVELPDVDEAELQRIEAAQSSPIVPVATSQSDLDAAIEALDTVPLKIVQEVCTRANNSGTSKGRVRLLNDVEEKKYAAHGVELMPALLREWLVIDGLNGEPGFNKDGVPRVANTGGAKREPMDARLKGKISLSEYLATKGEEVPTKAPKKGRAAPAQGDDSTNVDAFGQPVADAPDDMKITHDPRVTSAPDPARDETPLVVQSVRGTYEQIDSTYTINYLVELAQKAANGAERAKVFHEITARKAWEGWIAAEINQYYLDHGYATIDFDPYFEATAVPDGAIIAPAGLEELSIAATVGDLPSLMPKRPDGPVLNGDGTQAMPKDGPLGGFRQVYRDGEIVMVGGPLTVADWVAHGWHAHAGVTEVATIVQRCATQASLESVWNVLHDQPVWADTRVQEAVMKKVQFLQQ